jgi:hypothetical protein
MDHRRPALRRHASTLRVYGTYEQVTEHQHERGNGQAKRGRRAEPARRTGSSSVLDPANNFRQPDIGLIDQVIVA